MGIRLIEDKNLDGVLITPLKIIQVPGGDVSHAMKISDPGFAGFGEVYFSNIESGVVKAWKRHRKMTLNLVVSVGAIRFVMFDDRHESQTQGMFQEVVLSKEFYYRLTIPIMVWMGFQGVSENTSMLLNIADLEHLPEEVDRKATNEINFSWETNS